MEPHRDAKAPGDHGDHGDAHGDAHGEHLESTGHGSAEAFGASMKMESNVVNHGKSM